MGLVLIDYKVLYEKDIKANTEKAEKAARKAAEKATREAEKAAQKTRSVVKAEIATNLLKEGVSRQTIIKALGVSKRWLTSLEKTKKMQNP
jgi:hypothetical protein